mmetsp:Transcript_2599/g.6004  ORF Transcript_2599/g.6004 Transcript_2599/m.6004 type:complete len:335 (-) Transcript_2599:306-1310(-)
MSEWLTKPVSRRAFFTFCTFASPVSVPASNFTRLSSSSSSSSISEASTKPVPLRTAFFAFGFTLPSSTWKDTLAAASSSSSEGGKSARFTKPVPFLAFPGGDPLEGKKLTASASSSSDSCTKPVPRRALTLGPTGLVLAVLASAGRLNLTPSSASSGRSLGSTKTAPFAFCLEPFSTASAVTASSSSGMSEWLTKPVSRRAFFTFCTFASPVSVPASNFTRLSSSSSSSSISEASTKPVPLRTAALAFGRPPPSLTWKDTLGATSSSSEGGKSDRLTKPVPLRTFSFGSPLLCPAFDVKLKLTEPSSSSPSSDIETLPVSWRTFGLGWPCSPSA